MQNLLDMIMKNDVMAQNTYKIIKNVIIVLLNLQNSIIAKSLVVKKFQIYFLN
jgi:hypothetical protein